MTKWKRNAMRQGERHAMPPLVSTLPLFCRIREMMLLSVLEEPQSWDHYQCMKIMNQEMRREVGRNFCLYFFFLLRISLAKLYSCAFRSHLLQWINIRSASIQPRDFIWRKRPETSDFLISTERRPCCAWRGCMKEVCNQFMSLLTSRRYVKCIE